MLDSIDNKNLNSESLKNEEVLDNMIVTDPTEISKNKKKLKLNRIQLFTLYFFLFAFIGWLMETVYAIFTLGHFVKRGFLFGPICPIYGYGALMLIYFLGRYRKNNLKLFFYAAILFSAFEYVTSYVLDALFGMHWWDYSNDYFNLNGRITLSFSIAWGIIAILFVNHVYPFFKKKLNIILAKISYKVKTCIIYILSFIFIIDTIFSCIKYLL